MAKTCQMCESKISFLSRNDICDNCRPSYSQWLQIMAKIDNLRSMPDSELSKLLTFGRKPLIKLYSKLYTELTRDNELDNSELDLLDRVQSAFGLSKQEIDYNDNVLPYVYVSHVRKTSQLPVPKLELDIPVILKKGEFAHYAAPALLREMRVVNLGYKGGSHGVSIRIMKGVSYRVGAHRGHAIKEDQLIQTSAGVLVTTNQRLFLVPTSGNKPVTIPVKNVHFYRCAENALEVYKEGREKGFYFIMKPGDIEIFGICLGVLLPQQ